GMVRTPDGNAVALSPSLVGRAPAPPQWKITVLNSGSAFASVPSSTSSTSEPPPNICGFHSEEAPSAGTGITCCRQPNTTSGNIDVDGVIGNGRGCIEDERLVIAVHGHAVAIGALRQSTDTAERRLARGFDDGLAEPVKIGDFELVHHFDQATTALFVARRGRVDVALHLQRLAYIGASQAQQVIIHAPLAGKRHDRNGQALLKDLRSVRP